MLRYGSAVPCCCDPGSENTHTYTGRMKECLPSTAGRLPPRRKTLKQLFFILLQICSLDEAGISAPLTCETVHVCGSSCMVLCVRAGDMLVFVCAHKI